MTVWAKSRWFRNIITGVPSQLTVVSNHGNSSSWGPRKSVRYWTGTHTRGGEFREPKRLSSFEQNIFLIKHNYLRIQPQKTMWATGTIAFWQWCPSGVSASCICGLGEWEAPLGTPLSAWNLWRPRRRCRATERRTAFTEVPV